MHCTLDQQGKSQMYLYMREAKVLYICVRFLQLAHESHDLSQAKTEITLVKSKANSQNDFFFKLDHF